MHVYELFYLGILERSAPRSDIGTMVSCGGTLLGRVDPMSSRSIRGVGFPPGCCLKLMLHSHSVLPPSVYDEALFLPTAQHIVAQHHVAQRMLYAAVSRHSIIWADLCSGFCGTV
jgi:hypothetical protein